MKRKQLFVGLAVLLGLGAVLGLGIAIQTHAQGKDVSVTDNVCALAYDKTAFPTEVDAGGVVTVTLSLQAAGDCSAANSAVDVVLVIDRSGSMVGQRIADAKEAAIGFVRLVDLAVDQVGVVSFHSTATLDQPLTQNVISVTQAISELVAGGGTRIASGLQVAEEEFLTSGHHLVTNAPVIVLLSDGGSSGNDAETANRIKKEGIRIVSIGLGSSPNERLLREVASSESDYYEAPDSAELAEIYRRIARTVRVAARDMVLTDTLSSYVFLVPASFQGPITPTFNGDQVGWHVAAVPTQALTLSYQVTMTETPNTAPGWPTNESATATYVDASGNLAAITFPVPYVRVLGRWKAYLPAAIKGGMPFDD
jgi:Mg-chelatase subunit ChlD